MSTSIPADKWFTKHKVALLALAGSVGTWAVTYFPGNRMIEIIVGLVVAVTTGGTVHVTNQATTKAAVRKARTGARK